MGARRVLICYHNVVAEPGKTKVHKHDNSITRLLDVFLVIPLRMLFSFLPSNTPMFIYVTLLSPPPLRAFTHALLRKLVKNELQLPEGVLLLNKNDPIVSGALSLGVYEAFFGSLYRRKLHSKMTVVDIGANLGYYTLIASKHTQRVIAFEPEPENAALLERTIERNSLANVTLIRKGLGEKAAMLTLSLHPDNKGKHTLLPLSEKGVTSQEIAVTTLDTALAEIGVTHVDLIKIDIEGWEAKALRGANATIRASHPLLLFEFTPHRIRAAGDDPLCMLDELENEGYTLFIIDENHATLLPLDPEKLIMKLDMNDAYVNIFAESHAI